MQKSTQSLHFVFSSQDFDWSFTLINTEKHDIPPKYFNKYRYFQFLLCLDNNKAQLSLNVR